MIQSSRDMHLLCGFESIQGTGAHAESLRDLDERGQGACIGKDNHDNTN